MNSTRKKAVLALGAALALGLAGAAVAGAFGDDDATDKPITGSALQRASQAALDHVGGGKVTETERGDEEGPYEVEVTRPGGGQVDVHLDEQFNVLSTEGDNGGSDD